MQVDVQRAKLPQTRARGEYEMENTIKVLQHKESKLSGTFFVKVFVFISRFHLNPSQFN